MCCDTVSVSVPVPQVNVNTTGVTRTKGESRSVGWARRRRRRWRRRRRCVRRLRRRSRRTPPPASRPPRPVASRGRAGHASRPRSRAARAAEPPLRRTTSCAGEHLGRGPRPRLPIGYVCARPRRCIQRGARYTFSIYYVFFI